MRTPSSNSSSRSLAVQRRRRARTTGDSARPAGNVASIGDARDSARCAAPWSSSARPHRRVRARAGRGVPRGDPGEDRLGGTSVRGRQCGSSGGDIRGCAPANRVAAAATDRRARDRDRGERRTCGPRHRFDPSQHHGDIVRVREARPAARRAPRPDGSAAKPRSAIYGAFSVDVPRDRAGRRGVLIPFLLDGVAGVRRSTRGTGSIQTARGIRERRTVIWPTLERALRASGGRP